MFIKRVLLLMFLHISFFVNAAYPDANKLIKDGLTLSHLLKKDELQEIKNYLQLRGFEANNASNNKNDPFFFKYLDDNQREVLKIMIHFNKGVSVSHYHFDKGSKFPDAVRSKLLASDYFKQGSDENEFLFSFPKKDKSAASENDDYQFQSKILFNDVVIIFVVPSIASEDIDWVNKIQELTL